MPHILLIEDNPGDARLIREMYKDADIVGTEHVITHVQRVNEALRILARPDCDIDLILSDMSLPDSQGIETLNSLSTAASELPVIFMTGSYNETFVSTAIGAGAQDYLIKGTIDGELLRRATTYSIERKKAQKQFDSAVKKADALAHGTEILKQQKKDLMVLNKAKDEFISLASHQLRTPATAVKQYLGMIVGGYAGDVPEDLLVFIRTAYDSNERQLTIINDLLKTAQIDSGRYALVKKAGNMCLLVADVIKEYGDIIAMRNQTIIFNQAKACVVTMDPIELKVVIANLIENASKYSPPGSTIIVDIITTKTHAKVSVTDHGVGLAKEDTSRIFERFTRLDNELSDTVSGSGLGLYFVKRIIKMHHGTINVKSATGQGSVFTISLPL